MLNDFSKMTVLVTGGTKGIGLAITECFIQAGATVYATYLWGDNLTELEDKFSNHPNKPIFLQANVAKSDDTEALIKTIKSQQHALDIFISNAAFAPSFKDSYQLQQLHTSIEHNAWPLVTYLDSIKNHFGHHPKYVVATTSEGHRAMPIKNYDYVAISKAVLETLVNYQTFRSDININCISPGIVDTEAFELIFGQKAQQLIHQYQPQMIVKAVEVAKVALALCSGLMDAVTGQIIRIDKGQMYSDNAFKWLEILSNELGESDNND